MESEPSSALTGVVVHQSYSGARQLKSGTSYMLRLFTTYIFPTVLFAVASVSHAADQPLQRAHAHNDYLHDRPLLDALDNGFCSVEADIFLIHGQLLVAHTRLELSPDRTLQNLYLDPLQEQIRNNRGRVHKNGPVFSLLIDIKNTGEKTWTELNKVLAGYADIISRVEDGQFYPGPVNVVVSGDRAWNAIEVTSPRFAGVDGRVSDIGGDRALHLMPLISDNWRLHFQWRGENEFPSKQRDKLHRLVRQTHEEGRRIRFWASPDTRAAWKELNAAGADLINTDDLPGLSEFLRSNSE